jgi:hypothetical protein
MSAIRKHRSQLGLEALEDRTVPSTLFGADTQVVPGPGDFAAGTWHADRYMPAGHSFGQAVSNRTGVLDVSISKDDAYGGPNRTPPTGYNSVFYDFQGLKSSLAANTTYLAAYLYVPAGWADMTQQGPAGDPAPQGALASLWAAAVDGSHNIVNYSEIGFNSKAGNGGAGTFQIKDRTTGVWTNVGGFTRGYDQWYQIGFGINNQGQFDYFVDGQQVARDDVSNLTTPPAKSIAFSDVMLQGYNAGADYHIYWNSLRDTRANVTNAVGTNVNAMAGSAFTGQQVATFTDLDGSEAVSNYSVTITWGDQQTSQGTIVDLGGGNYQVLGSHTYATGGNYTVSVQITNPSTTDSVTANAIAAVATPVTAGMTGDTTFWLGNNGQNLIKQFNGNGGTKQLGTWLATTLPNLYGSGSSNNLAGAPNTQVLKTVNSVLQSPNSWEAQVLATALNVYATDSSLGGTDGKQYGFVTGSDLGDQSYNVGIDGAAFGVANNTTMTVNALLSYVNKHVQAYNGDPTLQQQVWDLFNNLNQAGSKGIG